MKTVSIVILSLVVGALSSCGGVPDVTTPNPSTAPAAEKPVSNSTAQAVSKQFADNTITVGKNLSATSSNPSGATGSAFSLGLSGVTLVNAVKSVNTTPSPLAAPMPRTSMLSTSMLSPRSGDCSSKGGYSQSGDTITYDCTYSVSGYVISLTGQVVANSNSVNFKDFKIAYDIASSNSASFKYVIVFNGGFTYTSTSINGRFDVSIDYKYTSAQGAVTQYSAATSTYYDNINFEGCDGGAKSGSITATSEGDGKVYKNGTVKIVYGPTCGTSTVFSD